MTGPAPELAGEQGLGAGSVVGSGSSGCWAGWTAGGCAFRKTSQLSPTMLWLLLCFVPAGFFGVAKCSSI